MQLQGEDNNPGDGGEQAPAFMQVDQVLNDFGNAEVIGEVARNDAVIFIVDCSPEIFKAFPDDTPQIDKVMKGYTSFLMSKVISNPNDKVGLMFYNVKQTKNDLKFKGINVVHELDSVSAERIKNSQHILEKFDEKYGFAEKKVPLYEVLWLFNNELKMIDRKKFNLRLFLFTSQDNPHPGASNQREQAINHAKKLASQQVQIELFPLQKSPTSRFDLRKFFVQVLTLDPEEVNEAVLDTSDKIMDLQQRLRQKEYKKRTLNREMLTLGDGLSIGVKIYGLYRKATKPAPKKLDARTNKPLQRTTKYLGKDGQVLHESDIGTFYPVGGEKVILSKADIQLIKNFEAPGMTLVGFKPKKNLKIYHNYRTSYFVYPDEQRVLGSSQIFDSLIKVMTQKQVIGIVKLIPRANCQLRICALLPQRQSYDQDHFQTPPGFNLIFLPYSQDIVTFTGDKTKSKPVQLSNQLVHMCKLLINNLTISDFDVRNFQNPSLQKFYAHLQAHALGEKEVEEPPDLLKQDEDAMLKCSDIIQMIKETLELEIGGAIGANTTRGKGDCSSSEEGEKPVKRGKKTGKGKAEVVKEEVQIKEEDAGVDLKHVENQVRSGEFGKVKIPQLKQYLKSKGLHTNGKKQQLIDRIIVFLAN